MKTYCENSVKNFASSSECPMFVTNSSPKNNFCSKAAFLCPENFGLPFLYWTDPLTATVGSLARIKEGDSLFYIYLYNFSSVMPKNHEKRELGNNSTHTPHKQDSRIDLSKNHAQHLENSECVPTFVMPNNAAHSDCTFTESDRNKAGIPSWDKSSLYGLALFGDIKKGVRPFYILTSNFFSTMPNNEKLEKQKTTVSASHPRPRKHRDYKPLYTTRKRNVKNLAKHDTLPMFALRFTLTSGHSSLKSRAFFMPVSICGVTPSYSCNGYTACSSSGTQRVGNSLCYIVTPTNLLSIMRSVEKQGLSGNNSTIQPTSAPRKRVSHKRPAYKAKFELEKDAKNCAYSFILTSGYLEDFRHYSRSIEGMDPHVINIAAIVDECFSDLNNNPL